MKGAIYIFFIFVLVFFLNLLLYIYVDGYRGALKSVKYGEDSANNGIIVIDDSYNINSIEERKNNIKEDIVKGNILDLGDVKNNIAEDTNNIITSNEELKTDNNLAIEKVENNNSEEKTDGGSGDIGRIATLGIDEKKLLEVFAKNGLGLYEIENKDDLLDIAGEYPDEYLQYGNEGVDVYMLTTREYSEVYGIFEVLEYEMPFTVNPENNFGSKSFYINLDKKDDKIRFILDYNKKVFGFKILKKDYYKIKKIILKLNN